MALSTRSPYSRPVNAILKHEGWPMASGETALLTRDPWVKKRRLTVAEYHRMGEVGILTPDERVELIEGELIVMSPITSLHAGTTNALNRRLFQVVGERGVAAVGNPVELDDFNEPQPAFSILKPRDDDYRRAHPRPNDVLLTIEVADSSLAYDRNVKRALYARHGIPEFWIVNLVAGDVEVCRMPEGGQYASISRVGPEGMLEPLLLPGAVIPVAALLG